MREFTNSNCEYELTERKFKMMLNRIPAGEYYFDAYDLFTLAAPASAFRVNYMGERVLNLRDWRIYQMRMAFVQRISDVRYGLEYFTKGRMSYIDTEDLNTLLVKDMSEVVS